MAIKVVKQTKKEYEYIPVAEREEENPVKVIIRPLTKTERAKLEDKLVRMNQDQSISIANATYILEIFRLGVVDIKGLVDEDGKEVKVEKVNGILTQEFVDMLPDEFVQEVGQVIVAISKDPQNADMYLGKK